MRLETLQGSTGRQQHLPVILGLACLLACNAMPFHAHHGQTAQVLLARAGVGTLPLRASNRKAAMRTGCLELPEAVQQLPAMWPPLPSALPSRALPRLSPHK